MLIRKVTIQNVRSFLDRQEFLLDGHISMVIGPNGGGKTNLLDTIVIVLRRYLYASMYAVSAPIDGQPERHEFRHNDVLNNMHLEKHSSGRDLPQIVEVEVEVSAIDVSNMSNMKAQADHLIKLASSKYVNLTINQALQWNLAGIHAGQRLTYRVRDGGFEIDGGEPANVFLQYLKMFEIDSFLREEFELAPLSTPMIYLPVNRAANGFQSTVQLANYNPFEQKRHNDATHSRTNTSIVGLAVGRLAQKFRLLLEKDKGGATASFRSDKNLQELTKLLSELGYKWELACIDPLKNQYDVRLEKQGSSFLVGAASSGERELFTYLFAIFALNVRDALIIVDEPELHLHPKWQQILMQMFIRLSESTGNQFLLATHSPTFVSPQSISFISRVFSREQRSRIQRLNSGALPEIKHQLNIVNSHNNERIFFSDKVVLVEGLSDRIFFEAYLDQVGRGNSSDTIIEIVAVGGKGFFQAYEKLLQACQIQYALIADLDYVEDIGSGEIKKLFQLDAKDIKKDVIDNEGSLDGETLTARIDEAMRTGNWGDAFSTWEYIKSRRRKLRADLKAEEEATLQRFIAAKRADNVYILAKGALEAYLPEGYKSKDLDKLIRLVAEPTFISSLPGNTHEELKIIARDLLGGSYRELQGSRPTGAKAAAVAAT